ncbi:hypothetical protein AQUCO_00700132v1 [Aquilegia coerulea]|uniref:Vacuolar amino acid transporter YPQ1 n=1 Tax=Aquilegia coerulea TaxID=218851 RepID=A0A2G5EIP6_AQUCA|nr:hypothetical protein AQUCO_00700132v1 [Aquilegia coerulea]
MSSASYCYNQQKPCIRWVKTVFKDCLCDLSDEVSFAFGLISLVCWGVAEIPQIITNFSNKSGHGVSLAFLLTWVAGDMFNLIGCLLEPATLPTQFYTALLYTISTVVLVLQSVYYDYISKWWKNRKKTESLLRGEEDTESPLNPRSSLDSTMSIPSRTTPLRISSQRKDVYFTSARSLARSDTPPYGSYLRQAKSGPSALGDINSSSEDESDYSPTSKKSSSKPITIPRSVGYGTFLATSATLPFGSKALVEGYSRLSGRRLLNANHTETHSVYGVWLGWMMAAIYMGGRIPQIFLNIKRGSVEGLNPLMFIFALVANAAYVGSILVRSTEWAKIKPNMPWLLDAVVCVALDLFVSFAIYLMKLLLSCFAAN